MKKVLLGMSGGVDSSVSAILLKEAGYEVTGVTMELCENSSCCNFNTYIEAKNICKELGIEHYIYNLSKEFKEYVIDDFIDNYKNCKTPNPCIECNKYLKFGIMYEKAKEMGIDFVATGHYAKVEYSEKYGRFVLKKSNNKLKDQSYVLYSITRDMLDKIVFPLGDFYSKDDVREIAKKHNFKVASKPDSEDICFIPDGNYANYLEKNSDIEAKEGNIVDGDGNVLGKHCGIYHYTIGQRKGLGIAYKEPLYVIGFNKEKNEVIVGEKEKLKRKEFLVGDYNLLLIDSLDDTMEVKVKTRYSQNEYNAIIEMTKDDKIKVTLLEDGPSISPGQSAVFYIDDIVLGGGKIL